jgi:CheY-like chemotaxis protein
VKGDAGRLRQILTNLIGNAVKFTEQGQVQLRMRVLRDTEDAVTLELCVVDTGIGIGLKQQSRLFQSFVQADDSMSRKYGGTGLGLAISRQLVEMLGGSIGVESKLGEGSRFWFTAIFHKLAPGEQIAALAEAVQETQRGALAKGSLKSGTPENQAARSETAQLPTPRDGTRILLVEDNLVNQRITQRLLEKAGFQVGVAANGRLAVEAFQNSHYDLILMDCQMPEMDGYEATQAIRHIEGSQEHIPIIAITAHAMEGDREKCLACGMDDYLSKPTALVDLHRVITTWLGRDRHKALN